MAKETKKQKPNFTGNFLQGKEPIKKAPLLTTDKDTSGGKFKKLPLDQNQKNLVNKVVEKLQEYVITPRLQEILDQCGKKINDLAVPGYPIIPSERRMMVKELDQNLFVTKSGLLVAEGRGASAAIGMIMSISPGCFVDPAFFYKPGDLVYYNQNAGNYMRLKHGNDMQNCSCMGFFDVLGLFSADPNEYFGRDISKEVLLPTTGEAILGDKDLLKN